MRTLTKDELKSLIRAESDLCISLYLPTARAGKATLESPVRFRSLLRRTHETLIRNGVRASVAEKCLNDATALLDDYPFWQHQEDGLAVFLSADFFRPCRIPYRVAPLSVVSSTFHLKPLLPLLAYDGRFFVLALSGNMVELYRASRYTIDKVPLKNVPRSLAQALPFDNPEKSLQTHTFKPSPRGGPTGIVHGQGARREDAKNRTLRFFQKVNEGLHRYLKDEHAPLVFAGVEENLPIYREANTYPHLLDDAVTGNPESLRPEELLRAAWEKVEPRFQRCRELAAAAAEAGLAMGRATDRLDKAVAAACQGRADKCFVVMNEQRWGMFHAETASIERLDRMDRHGCDLLDFAAIQTLLHGGDTFPVTSLDNMPGRAPLVVQYRF